MMSDMQMSTVSEDTNVTFDMSEDGNEANDVPSVRQQEQKISETDLSQVKKIKCDKGMGKIYRNMYQADGRIFFK